MSRRFELVRTEDLTGMSGTGVVAWGVQWPDGRVALRWNTEVTSSATYDCIDHVVYLHGHEGRTTVRWVD